MKYLQINNKVIHAELYYYLYEILYFNL